MVCYLCYKSHYRLASMVIMLTFAKESCGDIVICHGDQGDSNSQSINININSKATTKTTTIASKTIGDGYSYSSNYNQKNEYCLARKKLCFKCD